jgi:hypothetical protein
MAAGEEKEVTMTPATSTEGTRKRGRPRRNKTQRSGEAVVTKEETVIPKKGTEPARAKEQVFKLVPKMATSVTSTAKKLVPTATAPVIPVIPTKVTILPKKRVQKITILSKTHKKPLISSSAGAASPVVKQKIILPSQTKKTRKQYKERKLRIEL